MTPDKTGNLERQLADALAAIESDNIETRVSSVELMGDVVGLVAAKAASLLTQPDSDLRFLVAERLGRFGTVVLAPLEHLMVEGDDEQRVLGAAVAAPLGSERAVDILIAAVVPDGPFVCLASRVLSNARVGRAAPALVRALLTSDLTQTDKVQCLVESLRRLGQPLPDPVRARLEHVEPSWLRDDLLRPL
jgi:hypothetical protein